jgi:hypothetical protein
MNVDLYLHVRVLISMILGLSVTRLVGGVAGLLPRRGLSRCFCSQTRRMDFGRRHPQGP